MKAGNGGTGGSVPTAFDSGRWQAAGADHDG